MVEWPSGEATACKAVHTGSIPVAASNTLSHSATERLSATSCKRD